jgi:hypothetical protein
MINKHIKNKGHKTDPCGTTHSTTKGNENMPEKCTKDCQLNNRETTQNCWGLDFSIILYSTN